MQVRFKAALAAAALLTGIMSIGEAQAITVLPPFPPGNYMENYNITSSVDIPGLITANVYPDGEGFTTAGYSVAANTPTVLTDPFPKNGPISGTLFFGHDFDSDSGEHLVLGLNPAFGASVTGASFDGAFGSYDESDLLAALDGELAGTASGDQVNYLFGFIGQVYSENGTFAANGGLIDVVNFSDGTQIGTGNAFLTAVPEPATWTMLLLGFGVLGWTLRQRRSGVAA